MRTSGRRLAAWSLMVAGCSGVIGGGSDDDSDGAPRPDANTGVIASSMPAEGSAHVSPVSDVTVTLRVAADSATVSTDTVVLELVNPVRRLFGDVSWDAGTNTITFRPYSAFPLAERIRLRLQGVMDTGGHAVDGAITFQAAKNPDIANQIYTAGGAVMYLTTQELDESGATVRTRVFDDSGMDGMWGTGDDRLLRYEDFTIDNEGKIRRAISRTGVGPDMMWYTPDDMIEFYVDLLTVGDKRGHVSYVGRGTDNKWLTADDVPGRFNTLELDPAGHLVRETDFDTPGVDMMWFTPDDHAASSQGTEYDTFGYAIRRINYLGPGPDGAMETADDVIDSMTVTSFDAIYNPTQFVRYGMPGTDTMWGTGDDVPANGGRYTYDAAGHLAAVDNFRAGTDALIFTPDDVETGRSVFTVGLKDLVTRQVGYDEDGTDNMWNTPDDRVKEHNDVDFDASGFRLQMRHYSAAGTDGMWLSPDDHVDGATNFNSLL